MDECSLRIDEHDSRSYRVRASVCSSVCLSASLSDLLTTSVCLSTSKHDKKGNDIWVCNIWLTNTYMIKI